MEQADVCSNITGYVTCKRNSTEYWLLLCTEYADVRPILATIRDRQEKVEKKTVYLQCYTDLAGFYQRYSELRQEQKGSVSRKIRQAIDYMRTHYAEPISVENTAQAVGISKTTCTKYLKPKQDARSVSGCKIQDAKSMRALCNTNLKNYEIAEMVGFTDSAYFCATFKKVLV